MVHLNNDWDEILAPEFQSDYYKKIRYWLKKEYAEQTIYPPMEDIFNALRYTPYHAVKAVLLGQDPDHGPGRRMGCVFRSRRASRRRPRSKISFRSWKATLASLPRRTAR